MSKFEITTVDMELDSESSIKKSKYTNIIYSINIITLLSLVSSTFGVSSMGLPSTVAKLGIFLFPFILLLSVMVNYLSYLSFVYLTDKYNFKNFSEYSSYIFGNRFKCINDFLLVLLNIGNLLANCVIANMYICNIFIDLGFKHPLLTEFKTLFWIFMVLLITFPIVIKQKLKDLALITIFTVVIIIFFILFTIYNYFISLDSLSVPKVYNNYHNIPTAYSYFFFCFSCQQNLIIIYNEMENKSVNKILNAVKSQLSLMFITYTIIGLLGYLTFYDNSLIQQTTYLDLFKNNSYILITANIMMTTMAIIAYIFTFKPTRDILEIYLSKKENNENIEEKNNKEKSDYNFSNLLLSVFIVFLIFCLSVMVIKMNVQFLKILGAMSNFIVPLIFVFLPIFYYIKETKKYSISIFLLIPLICFLISFFEIIL